MSNKYNTKFDELENQGLDLEEIPKIIRENNNSRRNLIIF